MYGLPQAGIIAQQLLEERLEKDGYRQSKITPGLWTHDTRPISFSLVVDDFGVKYVGEENAQHLLDTVQKYYKCSCDWKGERYCGLTIKWDYAGRKVHLSMPGYVRKALTRFQHKPPAKRQDQPYPHVKPNYGAKQQYSQENDNSPALNKAGKNSSKRCVEFFCSSRERSMGDYSPLSALSRPNKRTQQREQWSYTSSFWTSCHARKKQYSPIERATWFSQSTAMRRTSPSPNPAAAPEATCS